MTRAANFAQLADGQFQLQLGGGNHSKLLFQDVSIFDTLTSGEGTVLSWNVRQADGSSVTYEVRSNGQPIRTHTVTSGDWVTIQEAMHTDDIVPALNHIEFRVIGGTGTLFIGDVILWYRKEITDDLTTPVADYLHFSDEQFQLPLEGGNPSKLLFRDISIFDTLASGEGTVLSWNVRQVGGGSVTYEVKVNGQPVRTHTVTSEEWITIQEAMHTDDIVPALNHIEFRVTAGTGTLFIGDVLLWYRKEIADDSTTPVADFAQLADGQSTLQLGGDNHSKVFSQDISESQASGEGTVLRWNVRQAGGGSVTYEVKVNGQPIRTHTITSEEWITIQEAMHTDDIVPGMNNIEFRVTGGTGTLFIGDVILWYRKEIAEALGGQVVWTLRGRMLVAPQLSDVKALATVNTSPYASAPLAGVRVQVSGKEFGTDLTWDEWGDTFTDANGYFTIRHVKDSTPRRFRVRVQFKNEQFRVYPPNDSLLKMFVELATDLIPGGVLTQLTTDVAEDLLEQLLEQSTRVTYDVKWITVHQDSVGDKHDPTDVDFGNMVFRSGAAEQLDGSTERRHAEIWLIAQKAIEYVNGLGGVGFHPDRSLAFLYPHNNPAIGDGVERSYNNPHNDIVYLVNNSQSDDFNANTILHELFHSWVYQHTSGEERLATYLLLHGSTHDGRLAPWVAWHEALAEVASNEVSRAIFGTNGTITFNGKTITAERKPLTRPYLISQGITRLDDVQAFEDGWIHCFSLLLCPDVCDLDMTSDGPYATDTSPGIQGTAWPLCSDPKINFADLLRVVADAPDGRDGGMVREEMQLGLFLRRCSEVLPEFTMNHADAFMRILDPQETSQPGELLNSH